jgi:hypothetical protein
MADSGVNVANASPAARKVINTTPTSRISLGPNTSITLSRLPGSFQSKRSVPKVPNLLTKKPHFAFQVPSKNRALPTSKGAPIVISPYASIKSTGKIKKPTEAKRTQRLSYHTPSTSKPKGSKSQAYLQ